MSGSYPIYPTTSGVRIVDMPDLGAITNDSSVVAEHIGSGRFSAPALRTYIAACYGQSVVQYGAVGDGATNDTAAFQSAINAAVAGTGVLYVPGGNYLLSGVTIAGALTIIGAGADAVLLPAATNTTTITITTPLPVHIERLSFGRINGAFQVSGPSLSIVPPAGSVSNFVTITWCSFYHAFIAISFEHAALWRVERCFMQDCTNGVTIRNTGNIDYGDNSIIGCTFSQWGPNMPGGAAVGIAINHFSPGGFRLSGNKILQHQYGYVLNLDLAGAGTSDLHIISNSFESQSVCSVQCQQAGNAADFFHNILIQNNQFAYAPKVVRILAGTGANWLSHFTISNNIIESAGAGTGPAIDIGTGAHGVISGNVMASDGGTETAIATAAGVGNCIIAADNRFTVFTTNVNPGAGTLLEGIVLGGTGSANTSTAYGSLFYGVAAAITFAGAPFKFTPAVTCSPTSTGTGAVSVVPTSITPTGFTPTVIGVNNASAIAFNWLAGGT